MLPVIINDDFDFIPPEACVCDRLRLRMYSVRTFVEYIPLLDNRKLLSLSCTRNVTLYLGPLLIQLIKQNERLRSLTIYRAGRRHLLAMSNHHEIRKLRLREISDESLSQLVWIIRSSVHLKHLELSYLSPGDDVILLAQAIGDCEHLVSLHLGLKTVADMTLVDHILALKPHIVNFSVSIRNKPRDPSINNKLFRRYPSIVFTDVTLRESIIPYRDTFVSIGLNGYVDDVNNPFANPDRIGSIILQGPLPPLDFRGYLNLEHVNIISLHEKDVVPLTTLVTCNPSIIKVSIEELRWVPTDDQLKTWWSTLRQLSITTYQPAIYDRITRALHGHPNLERLTLNICPELISGTMLDLVKSIPNLTHFKCRNNNKDSWAAKYYCRRRKQNLKVTNRTLVSRLLEVL